MNEAQARTIPERLDALEVAVRDIQLALKRREREITTSSPDEREHGELVQNALAVMEPGNTGAALEQRLSSVEATNFAPLVYPEEGLQTMDKELAGRLTRELPEAPPKPPKPPTRPNHAQESPAVWSPGLVASKLSKRPSTNFDIVRDAGFWLSKVGIVLFLFGVVFLLKYAVDRNWLNEQSRAGTGLLLGSLLFGVGLLVHRQRRQLSQVLLGGSIATYYITGYATYYLLPTLHVSHEQVFVFMLAVTLLAFVISVRQGEVVLALIGLVGGILTPFALGMQRIELPGLVGYTCLLLAATSAIYLFRGWRSLLWCGVVGGWALLVVGYLGHLTGEIVEYNDRIALQGGAAFLLLTFWALPVVREVLFARSRTRWPRPLLPHFLISPPGEPGLLDAQAHILSVLMPASVLTFSAGVWGELVTKEMWGLIELAGAGVFCAVFLVLRRVSVALIPNTQHLSPIGDTTSEPEGGTLAALAYTQAMVAIGLLTLGLLGVLEGNLLLLALSVEGTLLHFLSRRFGDQGSRVWGHLIFGLAGSWLAVRILFDAAPEPTSALTNPRALTDLLVIALALGVSFLFHRNEPGLVYRSVVHVAALGWLWRELHVFPEGIGYVMLAWAAYGLLLHVVSRRIADGLNSIGTSVAAHLAFEGAMGLLAFRLVQGYEGVVPMFNGHAALDLVVIAMALASSFVVRQKDIAAIYRVAMHVAVLAWLCREATDIDGWQAHGYVMLRWAAYLMMAALVSHRLGDRISLIFLNGPYALVAGMLGLRIMSEHGGNWALLNARSAVDLVVVCLALLASVVVQPRAASVALRITMHVAVLGVLWRELSWLPNGYDLVVFAWAIYAAGVQAFARWRNDQFICTGAHAFFAISGLWLLERIAYGLHNVNEDRPAIFTTVGLANLGVIATAAVICFLVRRERPAFLYGLWLHIAILGWTWQELGLIPNGGNGYVTIAWGGYAILLVLAGLRMERNKPLVFGGLSTLFIVAGKLFLIDLRYLEAPWRILLFLGFGGLFLLLSYFFQGVTKRPNRISSDWSADRGRAVEH